jgi:DNA-binding CsgD family transcriptional regulator
MSISSIPSFSSDAASSTATGATNTKPAPQQPPANASTDSVQLTEAEQVYQLYMQGQPVSQIALNLGLPEALVNNYLNLSPTGT